MSKADMMFEKLGYEKEEGLEGFDLTYIKYTKKFGKMNIKTLYLI